MIGAFTPGQLCHVVWERGDKAVDKSVNQAQGHRSQAGACDVVGGVFCCCLSRNHNIGYVSWKHNRHQLSKSALRTAENGRIVGLAHSRRTVFDIYDCLRASVSMIDGSGSS